MRETRHGVACATALLAAVLAACSSAPLPAPPEGVNWVEDTGLSEMSGLVASARDPGVLWSINDSGSLPRLYRLDEQGRALGRVWVNAWWRDTESLAIWREGDTHWLLVGDVGDNRGVRDEVVVHALAEPARGDTRAQVAWTLRFRYPDGPRDAEGIAVDVANGDLLVLSKRDKPARLYRVPLSARDAEETVVAEYLGSPAAGAIEGDATGLDLDASGRQLMVLSYGGLYLWLRTPGEPWASVLARPPQVVPMPRLRKAEALALSATPGRALVGAERLPTPLWSSRYAPGDAATGKP